MTEYWYGKPQVCQPGPGRNIPNLSEILQQAKVRLKSPEVIEALQAMNRVPETMLVRERLKHIDIPPRQTEWPCMNPIFIELRRTVKLRRR